VIELPINLRKQKNGTDQQKRIGSGTEGREFDATFVYERVMRLLSVQVWIFEECIKANDTQVDFFCDRITYKPAETENLVRKNERGYFRYWKREFDSTFVYEMVKRLLSVQVWMIFEECKA